MAGIVSSAAAFALNQSSSGPNGPIAIAGVVKGMTGIVDSAVGVASGVEGALLNMSLPEPNSAALFWNVMHGVSSVVHAAAAIALNQSHFGALAHLPPKIVTGLEGVMDGIVAIDHAAAAAALNHTLPGLHVKDMITDAINASAQAVMEAIQGFCINGFPSPSPP
eukprot:6826133-Prymnesium_polylepis.1